MEDKSKDEFVIHVNKKEIKVAQEQLTGAQILTDAGLSSNEYDLYLVHGQSSQQISADTVVDIKNGLHFNAILRSVPYG